MPGMTIYEVLMMEKQYAIESAKQALEKNDFHMASFYQHAAIGFGMRMNNLRIRDL